MKKIFLLIFLFLYFLFLIPSTQYASENFSTGYDVTYSVLESGLTHVSMNAALTNTTSKYYATSYKLNVGFENVINISASDQTGKINPKLKKVDSGYDIELDFNDKVVGIGKAVKFNLSFDTKDVASKQGTIWEINIPGITNQENFTDFNVHVKVPPGFGQPAYIKPSLEINGLNFTKAQLGRSGISIGFGEAQTYRYKLNYHLKNTRLFPIKTEIALPPTTNYQDVFIEDINPKPINVTKDEDGNWMAQFRLSPSQQMDITVSGLAKTFLYPKKEFQSEKYLNNFLKERPFWETSDSKLKKLAKELETPYAIYDYVAKSLTYDFSRVTQGKTRLGAKAVLYNPTSAVCLEFTDLFVALARAAGIPAREVDGYAYTQNEKQRPVSLVKDVLHAWPEYYDKNLQAWVMVDPTWGNTTKNIDYFSTLDFDHLVFVIKGKDSSYPIPAGGYKLPGGENNKDVDINFTDETFEEAQNLEIKLDVSDNVYSGIPIKGNIIIKNTGGNLLTSQIVNVQSDLLLPNQQNIHFEEIPPFGYVTKEFVFDKTPILTNGQSTIKISVTGKSISQTVKISPFFLSKWSILGGVLIAAIFIIIISIFAGRARSISISRRK